VYVNVGNYLASVWSIVYADVAVLGVHGSLDVWYEPDECPH